MSELIVLCGLPGSGKSTYAKGYALSRKNTVIVSMDSIRKMLKGKYLFIASLEPVIQTISLEITNRLLEMGLNVMYDETNLTRYQRKKICGVAPNNTDCVCLWFTEAIYNLEYRMRDPRGYDVEHWDKLIKQMKEVFEPPDSEIETQFSMIEKYSTSKTDKDKVVFQSTLLLV